MFKLFTSQLCLFQKDMSGIYKGTLYTHAHKKREREKRHMGGGIQFHIGWQSPRHTVDDARIVEWHATPDERTVSIYNTGWVGKVRKRGGDEGHDDDPLSQQ